MTSVQRKLAIIGTAGRDKSAPLTRELWDAMVVDLRDRVLPEDTLVSGGAAWADHLAVHAYLSGWCRDLLLFLPAPLRDGRYLGPFKSAGSAACYYHDRFSSIVGFDSMRQIEQAVHASAQVQHEPEAAGVSAMFVRNAKVARACNAVVAYTFGSDDEPIPGGTLDTWRQVRGDRAHVSLLRLVQPGSAPERSARSMRFGREAS